MDVSLAALRSRLFSLRSWDSTGKTLDDRIRSALNLALDRLAGEVPEALVPDEQHVVLRPDVNGDDSTVAAKVATFPTSSSDKRLLYFVDSAAISIAASGSATTWRPTITGEWDGIMHLEITDSSGQVHRRQSLEWFTVVVGQDPAVTYYVVSIDRPMPDVLAVGGQLSFRIHQPEFFVSDDVMEVLEPASIFGSNRQQVWKIDTAGAHRQNMIDYKGNSKGRPYRCWRGRHFQIPAPTEAPQIVQATSSGAVLNDAYKWGVSNSLREGTWSVRYTYVWGRRDQEWQQSPLIAAGGDQDQDSTYKLNWAYESDGTVATGVVKYAGVNDPIWESAPSPSTEFTQKITPGSDGGLVISATNIDAMLGFGDNSLDRFGRTGLRIRYYVSHVSADEKGTGTFNSVETNQRYYLLCEVEPTFDHVTQLASDGITTPTNISALGSGARKGGRVVWTGDQLYDYYRPLKHSTGYFAWKVYPHQDARYELDLRVLRLPRKYIDDQDTAPIQRDAVPSLIELALYYVSLDDGNDQLSANAHLSRYHDLVRVYRQRYANPGGVVEPVPLMGYRSRNRYGTFGSSD